MAAANKVSVGRTAGIGKSNVIPDSENHGDKERQLGIERLTGCHVNGEPVEDWAKNMPDEVVARMSFPLTDEGQREQKKLAREHEYRLPGGGVAKDPDDKDLIRMRDGLKNDNPEARGRLGRQPLQQTMDKYLPKGHRGLFLGDMKTKDSGTIRNGLDYRPVLDEDGKPVKQGGMTLASVPETEAREVELELRELAGAKLRGAQDKVHEQSERLMSTADMRRLARSKGTQEDIAGFSEDQLSGPEAAQLDSLLEHETVR